MAADGLAARGAAVAILDAVLGEGRMLADVLAEPQGPLAGLSPGDRARAQRLATGVLRHLEQADKVLAPHLRRAPPRSVQNVLRLAVVEMADGGAGAWGGERGGRPGAAGAADRAPGGAGERGAAQGGGRAGALCRAAAAAAADVAAPAAGARLGTRGGRRRWRRCRRACRRWT